MRINQNFETLRLSLQKISHVLLVRKNGLVATQEIVDKVSIFMHFLEGVGGQLYLRIVC